MLTFCNKALRRGSPDFPNNFIYSTVKLTLSVIQRTSKDMRLDYK